MFLQTEAVCFVLPRVAKVFPCSASTPTFFQLLPISALASMNSGQRRFHYPKNLCCSLVRHQLSALSLPPEVKASATGNSMRHSANDNSALH